MFKKFILVLALMTISTKTVLAKPTIAILATGGTIAGKLNQENDSSYDSGKILIDSLIEALPQISDIAQIKAQQISQIGSQDMNDEIWLKLAKKVDELANDSKIDGIVITHGTDTMEETAYFLNLVINTKKPIILVGAMRTSDSIGADGALNLYNAIFLAGSKKAWKKGVLVVVGEKIYSARDVSKTNTINIDALASPNSGSIGYINHKEIEFYYEPIKKHTYNSEFNINKIQLLPRVDIVYSHANQNSDIIKFLIEQKTAGIVLAGVGDGNSNKDVLQALSNAVANKISVVRSSRTGSGLVVRNSEINDDKYQFITSNNLNPQKARILLMLALTKTKDYKKIQEIFENY